MCFVSKPITVITVDPDHLARQGIKSQLQPHPKIEVVAEGTVGDDVFRLLEQYRPDILMLEVDLAQHHDTCLKKFQVFPAMREIATAYPETAVILLTRAYVPAISTHLVGQGVQGYLLKKDDLALTLTAAVLSVQNGGVYFSETVIREMFSQELKPIHLTRRQTESLMAIAITPNASYTQQAHNLGIAESTLKNHLTQAFKLLGAKNVTAAVLRCIQLGIIPVDSL